MQERITEFFEFIYKRQEIWCKRNILQQASPWTDDAVLATFKFCNVYRELDGGTLAIRKYIETNDFSPAQKLFSIIAYRFFNRRDTLDNLFGGVLNPEDFDFKKYEKRFDEKKKDGCIFSNAYLISSHPYHQDYRPQDKHVQILLMLEDLKKQIPDLLTELRKNPPQEGLTVIQNYVKMAGPFLAGQILLDATYAKDIVSYNSNDFLIVGPGAHWGLNIICGRKLSPKEADEKCRMLYKCQAEEFEQLKAKGKNWDEIKWANAAYPGQPYLSLHDIQNSLCEFRKYTRLKAGEKAKKRYFK